MPDTPRPRQPRGRALRWTDAELDAMTSPEALSSPEAIAEARLWWQRNAPPDFRELLDAEPTDDAPDATT